MKSAQIGVAMWTAILILDEQTDHALELGQDRFRDDRAGLRGVVLGGVAELGFGIRMQPAFHEIRDQDFGGPVRVRKNELIGEAVGGERPVHELAFRAKVISRQLRVRFSALIIVLPDDALDEPIVSLGSVRGAEAGAVRQSVLAGVLRNGLPGAQPIGGNELFVVRTRLVGGIRFV